MAKNNRRSAKRKTFWLVLLFIAVIVVALYGGYTFELKPRKVYMAAETQLSEKNYAEASKLYGRIRSYADSADMYSYTSCVTLFMSDRTEEAVDMYVGLKTGAKASVDEVMGSYEELGMTALRAKQYQKAEAYLSISEKNEQNISVLNALEIRKEAVSLMENSNWPEARKVLSNVDDTWIDASKLTDECYKNEFDSCVALSESDMNAAVAALEEIRDYVPAARFIKDLQDSYKQGLAWVREGDYESAYTIFEACGNYREAEAMLNKCSRLLSGETVNLYEVGEVVTLGSIDGEGIVWLVVNVEDGAATLVSQSPVARMAYNPAGKSTGWSDSALNKWFKSDFMKSFVGSEKEQISTVTMSFDAGEIDTAQAHAITSDELKLISGHTFSGYDKVWLSDGGKDGMARVFSTDDVNSISEAAQDSENDVMAVIRLKF